MKPRNREINIFSLSLMDVISGAMGAFLIVTVILARFHAVDQEKYKDPEKLRKRLDAAMHALAVARVGTEETIKDRFTLGTKPKTLGLSGGETVPEITALGKALRADIDTINQGFSDALQERGAATRALAAASAGTEKLFKDRITGANPKTLGLSRGNSVREITALDGALRADIDTIHRDFSNLLDQRAAAVRALANASAGTEKIFKDRIGARPQTLGLRRGQTLPEIKKLGQALGADIDTIYKEMQKHPNSVPGTPFLVTAVFAPCRGVLLEVASDEINPSTGKPYPPFTPPVDDNTIYVNTSLSGPNSQDLTWSPADILMKYRAIPGRHYKIYLVRFDTSCKGIVMMLGRNVTTDGHGRGKETQFQKVEHVSLSYPRDTIAANGGQRRGLYYLGTITVGADRNISFARASENERAAEMKAIQERVNRAQAAAKGRR